LHPMSKKIPFPYKLFSVRVSINMQKRARCPIFQSVWGRLWDPKEQEFTIEIGQGKGVKRFIDGTDAQDYYNNVTHAELAQGEKADINIEMIQYRYGVPRIVKSRILFA